MADRSIVVRLRAEVSGFKKEMAEATKAVEQTAKGTQESAKRADTAMGRLVQSARNNEQAWNTSGTALAGFGAAALGGLGLATKAAMDWESAWAGVQKTVDGTAPQMAALEDGLRSMARELPATHQEIAGVAEAAGQLGIATPNVLNFTRTMIDMGEATNMSAEQAATALARFVNIAGTSESDIGRLGAAVVGLGNNAATTESEIVEMALRIAGAGSQAGLSEGEMLGMASALSSVGIEAQAGGSAISQTMKRIGMEVDTGGDKLGTFAQVAGMTAEQFSTAWREEPAAALDAFVQGLSNTEQMGMSTNQVLADLGITAIRESDALLRLSGAGDILATNMSRGNQEFADGTALIEEASKRYETAESRIAMAKNALVDAAISIGGVVMPALADLADRVGGVAGLFADLPAPVHGAVGALGGVAGAGALAAGSFLLIFPRVMETVSAFKTLRQDMPGVASGLSKVGSAAGIAAVAFVGLNIAGSVTESLRDGAENAELLTLQLLNLSQAGDVTADSMNELVSSTVPFGVSVRGVGDALDLIDTDPVSAGIEGFTKTVLGVPTTVDVATESLSSLDGALSTMVSGGHLDEFGESFAAAVVDAQAYGHSAEELVANLPGLREALTPVATELGLSADNATLARLALEGLDPAVVAAASGMEDGAAAAGVFEEGLDGAGDAAADAAASTDEYYDSLRQLADEFITAERAALDYADSLEDTAKAAEENGKHWENGTEAADENKRALLDLAEQALATADSLAAEGKSGTFLEKAREDLIDVATEMTGSRELAEEYVNQLLGTPEEITTLVNYETEQAKEDWAALWDEIGHHPPEVPVGADTGPAEDSLLLFEDSLVSSDPALAPVGADTSGAQEEVTIWGSQVGDVPTTPVSVTADTEAGEATLRRFQGAVNESGGTVEINGETMYADEALDTLISEVNAGDGTVTINGHTFPADTSLMALIEAINLSGGVVDIDGDPTGANNATNSAKAHADGTTGQIDVNANTGGANSAINYAARDRTSTIRVTTINNSRVAQGPGGAGGITRAAGGPIYGPGTGTSDSVPVLASNGEHMLTAAEVALAGGHDSVYRMRSAIRAGALRFAEGGGIENGGYARPPVMSVAVPARVVQQSGPSTLSLDGQALGAIATAVRTGASQAQIAVGTRAASQIVQAGTAGLNAYGGRP